MVTLLITSFLLIAGITYVIYLWQRPRSNQGMEVLLPPPPRSAGLFEEDFEPPVRELESSVPADDRLRGELVARAHAGDKEALREAHATRNQALYDEVLNALTESVDSDKSLLALISYIARSGEHLRINRRLAERLIESWKSAPDRNSTAKALHVAALANEAGVYQAAIETIYQFWRDRRLKGISADELRQLIESEFWVLAPEARNSGAGFVLKRKLAHIRRQLVAAKESDR